MTPTDDSGSPKPEPAPDPGLPLGSVTIAGLALATACAAASLASYNVDLGNGTWDGDWEPQFAASWRLGAVLGYMSGSTVGHICALIAGYFGARSWSHLGGVLAGTFIGVVNVVTSAYFAMPATADEMESEIAGYVDTNPFQEPAAYFAMAMVLGGAFLLAWIGALVAEQPARSRHVSLPLLALGVPVCHGFLALFMITTPTAFGWR